MSQNDTVSPLALIEARTAAGVGAGLALAWGGGGGFDHGRKAGHFFAGLFVAALRAGGRLDGGILDQRFVDEPTLRAFIFKYRHRQTPYP